MPMAAVAGAAIAGPIIGGIIGNMSAGADRDAAAKAANDAVAIIDKIGAPPDLSKAILIEHFKQAGVLNPELEQQINLGYSKVSQITEDASLRTNQIDALQKMAQVGQGGLRPEDQAALEGIRSKVQQDTQAKLGQIQQSYQARGQAGAGNELAASLSAAQGGAQTQSEQGLNIASQASQRALQAIGQQSQMAGSLRSQDFNVNQAKAQAADLVAQFNARNAQSVANTNTQAQNIAQAQNLSQTQQIGNANVTAANNELLRQQQAKEQYWQDQMQQATAAANARVGQASTLMGIGQQKAQGAQAIGSGVGTGAASLFGYLSRNNANNSSQATNTNIGPATQYSGVDPSSVA